MQTHSLDVDERNVLIDAGGVALHGDLAVPHGAPGLVVFAHGSGSSRHSSRNRYVAEELRQGNLGTLLMDLLTPAEEQVDMHTRHIRFDIGLLADRLIGAMRWLDTQDDTRGLAGPLEQVAYLGREWFVRYLSPETNARPPG